MKSYTQFTYERHDTAVQFSLECLDATLKSSFGQPTMSPEDTKLAILHLMSAVKHSRDMNSALAAVVFAPAPEKKTLIQRLLRK